MQRAVVDTNTWVSGLIWGGPPRLLIQLILARRLVAATSPELLAEFGRVLRYPRIEKTLSQRNLAAHDLVVQFGLVNDVVHAPALDVPVCRDPEDDALLACALATNADFIVSGDKDLLVLQSFRGIPILTAARAIEHLNTSE